MVVGVGGGEHRLFDTAEKPLAQRLVGLERRQQLFAVVVAGRMGHQRIAVVDHRAFEAFAIQAQASNQGMDRHQHRPGDIVGIDLVARHQQRRRPALRRLSRLGQEPVDRHQPVRRGVMRLAAGAVQQVVEARAHDEGRALRPLVDQLGRPIGNALLDAVAVDQQVVFHQPVQRQRRFQAHVDQVQPGRGADPQHPAGLAGQGHPTRRLAVGVQLQPQRQRFAADQPDHHAVGLQPAQQRSGQYRGQGRRGGKGQAVVHASLIKGSRGSECNQARGFADAATALGRAPDASPAGPHDARRR